MLNSFKKSLVFTSVFFAFAALSPLAHAGDCLYTFAITHGDVANIRAQISSDPNLDINCEAQYGEYTGLTALMVTALYGVDDAHAKIASLIIGAGADVNRRQSSNGSTALMDAAMGNAQPVANVLLLSGAQVNLKNNAGLSALNLAIQYHSLDMVKALCSNGADLKALDPDGRTPLADAIFYDADHEEFASALIACGADVHETAADTGWTLLMSAVEARPFNVALVKIMLAAGADVNKQTKQGFTALMAAATTDSPDATGIEIAKALLAAGAIPILTGNDSRLNNLCTNCDALSMSRTYRMIWMWQHPIQEDWQETQMIWFLRKTKKAWLKQFSR